MLGYVSVRALFNHFPLHIARTQVASDWQLLVRMLLASSHLEDAKRAASNGFSAACEAARREDKAATMWMSLMSSDEIRKREQSAIVLQRVWRGSRVRFQPGVLEWRAFIKFQRGAHMVRGVRARRIIHSQ